MNFTKMFSDIKLSIDKNSPEILVGAGIIGMIATTILACKSTLKVPEIIKEHKENLEIIDNAKKMNEQYCVTDMYSIEEEKKDIRIAYTKTALNFAKAYAVPAIVGAASITSIIFSNRISHKRFVALSSAYITLSDMFKRYRGNVIERFGKEIDKELRFGVKEKEVETVQKDKNGKEKVVKKKIKTADGLMEFSDYAKCFDECSCWFKKDAELNKSFLLAQQAYANNLLKANGYLFLNDVYDMLDIPRTKAGQIVGWIYDPDNPNHTGDDYVDFGIYNIDIQSNHDFVNGYERAIWLDFNVDGNILNMMK